MKIGKDIQRLLDLARARRPDRERWGKPESYKDQWNARAEQAARLVPDGARVLEIGVGKGAFRALIEARCSYLGADLNPIDARTLPLDLDADPLPAGPFDMVVLLGVIEYLHAVPKVAEKLRAAAPRLLVSYCCVPQDPPSPAVLEARRGLGWVNDLDVAALRAAFAVAPFRLEHEEPFGAPGSFHDQRIFVFSRDPGA
jgi:hypothetical protein